MQGRVSKFLEMRLCKHPHLLSVMTSQCPTLRFLKFMSNLYLSSWVCISHSHKWQNIGWYSWGLVDPGSSKIQCSVSRFSALYPGERVWADFKILLSKQFKNKAQTIVINPNPTYQKLTYGLFPSPSPPINMNWNFPLLRYFEMAPFFFLWNYTMWSIKGNNRKGSEQGNTFWGIAMLAENGSVW